MSAPTPKPATGEHHEGDEAAAKKPKEGGDAGKKVGSEMKKTHDEAAAAMKKKHEEGVAEMHKEHDEAVAAMRKRFGTDKHPRLLEAEAALQEFEQLQKARALEVQLEGLRQQHFYTAPKGIANSAIGSAAAGGTLAAAASAPYLWPVMQNVAEFSGAGVLGGLALGFYGGGKIGEFVGKNFGYANAGKWIGRAAGGFGGAWVGGAAGTALAPSAFAGAVIGTGLYGLGRLEGYISGRPRAGTLKTVGRGLLLPFTGTRHLFRKLILNPLDSAWTGFKYGVEGKKRHGFFQHLTGTAPAIVRQPFDAIGGFFNGLTRHTDKRLENTFPTKAGTTIRNTVDSTVSAPWRLGKWLWADRGGGHGGDHGAGHH